MTPEQHEAMHERAIQLFAVFDDPCQALKLTAECLNHYPDDTETWVLRGDIYRSMGWKVQAAKCYVSAARTMVMAKPRPQGKRQRGNP